MTMFLQKIGIMALNAVEREAQWDQICIAVYITANFGGNNVKKFNLVSLLLSLSPFLCCLCSCEPVSEHLLLF